MKMRALWSFVTAITLAGAGIVAVPTAAHALTEDQYAAQVASLVNDARARNGLRKLKVSVTLSSVAQAWSERMGATLRLSHNVGEPAYYDQYPAGWDKAAENVAYRAGSTLPAPKSIHDALMDSAGHRANILAKTSTHLGVGADIVKRNGRVYVYVTQNFAAYPSSVDPDPRAVRSAERLAGATRYETARAVGAAAFPSSDEVVIVAGGQGSIVDGLVAAPFAASRKAPVLLSEKHRLGDATRAEVRKRAPSRAWIIGGTGVVSTRVTDELRRLGVSVTRLYGSDRYSTAAEVALRMPAASKAVVASGATANLIDAAAVSGPAAAARQPILLTSPTSLPDSTRRALVKRGTRAVTIVGGTGAVSGGVRFQLEKAGMSASRVGGWDRYSTATKVASAFASVTGTDTAMIASAADGNLIDAMTGGVLGIPTLLTGPNPASSTKQWVADRDVDHLVVVGGTGAVPSTAVSVLRSVTD